MFIKPQSQIRKGDHIRVWRWGYYHHGIYCGDGTVIHYGGDKGDTTIQRDSLETFALDSKIEVAAYGKSSSSNVVIERAESRLGEEQYNLLFNNCEHFANWCKTGQGKSDQVAVVFHTITQLPMYPLIFCAADGIRRIYANEMERARNPEHLPQPTLLLFQRFKKAYESKNVEDLADSISDKFYSDIYGVEKPDFLEFMADNFRRLNFGLSPHLAIDVLNICSWSDTEFSGVISMKANLQFAGIPTPAKWDTGKLFCEAKPEGEFMYWRITQLNQFKG